MPIRFDEIGERLRAYRRGQHLSAEQIAERLGISRAAVYRIESGDVVKIETIERIASVLGISTHSLLGVGVEYYSSPISYFERMRQIEERSDQIIAHFPPMSYLLTSNGYQIHLKKTLLESLPSGVKNTTELENEVEEIISILNDRKASRKLRGLSVVNFISVPEIERWLKLGVVGSFNLSNQELAERRVAARLEIEHLIQLIENEPMGVQIGLIEELLPSTTFQLFRTPEGTLLGLSPFRLGGELPNIRFGVAMVTTDEHPVNIYKKLSDHLWQRAHKGSKAIHILRTVLNRSGIDSIK